MSRPGPVKVLVVGPRGHRGQPKQVDKHTTKIQPIAAFRFIWVRLGAPGGSHFLRKKVRFLRISMLSGLSRSRRLPGGILARFGLGLGPLWGPFLRTFWVGGAVYSNKIQVFMKLS